MSEVMSIDESLTPGPVSVHTPTTMLALAIQQGADLQKLEKLMELQERWEANEARKAWVSAMSTFKANPPEIIKHKRVKFTSQKGTTEYSHATLGHVVTAITQSLGQHGLSHRWDTQQLDGGQVKVTCIITHTQGHSEQTSLTAGKDDTGSKNNIQALGSTITYLQRYTLLAATGLAAMDEDADDDGRGVQPQRFITPEQAAELSAILKKDDVPLGGFLEYLATSGKVDISKIEEIPANMFDGAMLILVERRKAKANKSPKEKGVQTS